jgi:hypothetical protein
MNEKKTGGYRDDLGKVEYALLPTDALEGVARVLTWACRRNDPPPYPERNWEEGMAWSRVFNSLMRHAWALWRGEDFDDSPGGSGFHHADHLLCNAMFLSAYFKRPHLRRFDDRPRPPVLGVVDPLKDCDSCGGTKGYHRTPCAYFSVEFRASEAPR